MVRPRSIRFTFSNDLRGNVALVDALACRTMPPGTHDRSPRQGITGFWIQLETDSGAVLYRRDIPSMMLAVSRDAVRELPQFDVLVPAYTDAATVALFAPPRDSNGVLPYLGAPSRLIGRFPIPAFDSLSRVERIVELPEDICGYGKGQILSVTNVIHHGRIDNIYNLVVLAERFAEGDQDKFLAKASDCISFLVSRPPFNTALGADALNVFFVKVASVAPYFNSTFTSGSTHIDWDTVCLRNVCDLLFSIDGAPYWNWAGLIVNNDERRLGTRSGDQFAQGIWDPWEFRGKDYVETFQHEFDHAAYHLGDEYGGTKGTYSGGAPSYPNLTTARKKEDVKWLAFLTEDVGIPTLDNPSECGKRDNRDNPVADSVVGSYAGGGGGYSCGIFHPQYKCVMNDQSKVEGTLCTVCLHEATLVVAKAAALLVPAPGAILYSPVTRSWSHALIAANVVNEYGEIENYDRFDAVVAELSLGTAGPAVRAAFQFLWHALPESIEVVESYHDEASSDAVWYLIAPTTHFTYFVHGFKVNATTMLALGEIGLPDYPTVTLFDGAMVGTETNLFAVDGARLCYGKLDSSGQIVGGHLMPQTVTGLNNDVSFVSVEYADSLIWVGVIDELDVKIAAYELMNAAWAPGGFVTMPVDSPTDFAVVRVVLVGNTIHALMQCDGGLRHACFDTARRIWQGSPIATPIGPELTQFDVTADEEFLYVVVHAPGSASLYRYSILRGTWCEPEEISGGLGLSPSMVLSSLGASVLGATLHIVGLVNQTPEHAMYELPSGTFLQPLTAIAPLQSLASSTGAMTVHATPTQLYVGLSEALVPSAEQTCPRA